MAAVAQDQPVKLVVDVAVLHDGEVALARYRDVANYDNQRGWFLPDDLLNHLEHPADGARRVLSEQLGLTVDSIAGPHLESFPGRRGVWHLAFHYVARLAAKPNLTLADGIREVAWFKLDSLPARRDVAHGGWAIDVLAKLLPEIRADDEADAAD